MTKTKTANALVKIGRPSVPAQRRDRTRYYMEAARADSTRKAYSRAWATFEAWCKANGHTAMPADPGCGAHHIARQIPALGHDVRLIPAQYVKAFLKGHKNDYSDAEAIAEAVQRPRACRSTTIDVCSRNLVPPLQKKAWAAG